MRNYRKAAVPVVGGLLLGGLIAGCTGDPARGGIFWSESKAKARQNDMWQTLQTKSTTADKAEARVRSLRSQLSLARAELARAQKTAASGSNAAAENENAQLERRIKQLEKEIRVLSSVD